MAKIADLKEGRRTKALDVYQSLRRRIISLDIPPGSAIRKDYLTDEFGVSRAPINDALARLRDEGLVDIAPQHGSFIAPIRMADVHEGMFVRRSLEPAAARQLTMNIEPALLDALDESLERQRNAVTGNLISNLHQLDEEFHGIILKGLGLTHTGKFLMSFSAHLMRARNLSIAHHLRADDTVAEHTRIVEAIRSGDPEWAASEMDSHLAAAYAALAKMVTPENVKDNIRLDDGAVEQGQDGKDSETMPR